MGCFNGSLYIFPFTRSMGKKWTLKVLLIELREKTQIKLYQLFYRRVLKFFYFSLIQFINWIKKYLHFGIIVYSSGVMYSMDNIEIENTLSIKQRFELFPCSYFKSQGNTNNRKFIPTEFFLKFLFRWTGSYQSYIWTMRNRGTFFLFIFLPPPFLINYFFG